MCPFTKIFLIIITIPFIKERFRVNDFIIPNNNRKILEITRNNRILYDSVVIWYDFEELPAMKIVYRSINRINIKKIY